MISANDSMTEKLRRRVKAPRHIPDTAPVSLWRVMSTLGAFSTPTFASLPSNQARAIDASPTSESMTLMPTHAAAKPSRRSASPMRVYNSINIAGERFDDSISAFTLGFYDPVGSEEEPSITTSVSVTSTPTFDEATTIGIPNDMWGVNKQDDVSNFMPTSSTPEPTTFLTAYRKRANKAPKAEAKATPAKSTSKSSASASKPSAQASKSVSSIVFKPSVSTSASVSAKAGSQKAAPKSSAMSSSVHVASASVSPQASLRGGEQADKAVPADVGIPQPSSSSAARGAGGFDLQAIGGALKSGSSIVHKLTAEPSQTSSALDPKVILDPNVDQMLAEDTVGVPPTEDAAKQSSDKSPSSGPGVDVYAASSDSSPDANKGVEGTVGANEAASPEGSQGTQTSGSKSSGSKSSSSSKASSSADPKGLVGSEDSTSDSGEVNGANDSTSSDEPSTATDLKGFGSGSKGPTGSGGVTGSVVSGGEAGGVGPSGASSSMIPGSPKPSSSAKPNSQTDTDKSSDTTESNSKTPGGQTDSDRSKGSGGSTPSNNPSGSNGSNGVDDSKSSEVLSGSSAGSGTSGGSRKSEDSHASVSSGTSPDSRGSGKQKRQSSVFGQSDAEMQLERQQAEDAALDAKLQISAYAEAAKNTCSCEVAQPTTATQLP
jgi:hypothetical protein